MWKKWSKLKAHHQLLCSIVIAFALVGIWRGIWRLYDLYLFPENPLLSFGGSLVIGIVIFAITHYSLVK